MQTQKCKIDPQNIDRSAIVQAAQLLKDGALVAFPTETVYGLGANGWDAAACKRIYQAKGRPSDNPLILHISNLDMLEQIVHEVPKAAKKLMDAFWPGPLTMIFPKADAVPDAVTGGLDTVAVRFPSHPVAMALIEVAALPIAAPSANTSGRPSPTSAAHVAYDLDGKIDMILDGGEAQWGLESTIVDVCENPPMILRPGAITKEMIQPILGDVAMDPTVLDKPADGKKPKAPGMKYTHYAPKADVYLVRGTHVAAYINALVEQKRAEGKRVGVLATEESKTLYDADIVLSVGSRADLEEVGAKLFGVLREFDTQKAEIVYAEVFPYEAEGLAIMNRLQKSAGYRFLDAE